MKSALEGGQGTHRVFRGFCHVFFLGAGTRHSGMLTMVHAAALRRVTNSGHPAGFAPPLRDLGLKLAPCGGPAHLVPAPASLPT